MGWATPRHSRARVDAAGSTLIDPSADEAAIMRSLAIINNWRSSHSFPLNTFQMTLRRRAREIDSGCLVAQRIKRLSSIRAKLERFNWLRLSEMQDIGGCRVVVGSVRRVDELVEHYKMSRMRHRLDDEDDYIRTPKKSGYRGVHLIYRYHSDDKPIYNRLKVEMQFRSPLQHAWATAVETVGTFVRQALKSSHGQEEWLRFFALMGTAIAQVERTPEVPNTPTDPKALRDEILQYATSLDVENRLRAYGAALRTASRPGVRDAHYYLLTLEPAANRVTVAGYQTRDLSRASRDYLETERSISGRPGAEAVLVSVESISALRRAYPNYFLDTRVFLRAVKRATAPTGSRPGRRVTLPA